MGGHVGDKASEQKYGKRMCVCGLRLRQRRQAAGIQLQAAVVRRGDDATQTSPSPSGFSCASDAGSNG
jgi:hypothetical protein